MKRLIKNIFRNDEDILTFNLMEVEDAQKKFLIVNVRSAKHLEVRNFEKGKLEATTRRIIEISSTTDLKNRIVNVITEIHPLVFNTTDTRTLPRKPDDFLYEVQVIANDEVQLEYNIPANLNAEGIYNHIPL